MCKYGESKTTRIMMASVPHVTSGLGHRKFQTDGFLLDRVYIYSVGQKVLFFWAQMFITVFMKACHWNLRELVEYIPNPHTLFT